MIHDMRKRMQAGFTLIELMIVIAIIGILAAIAIPNFLKFQLKSKFSECPENLGKIKQLEDAFQAKYGEFCPAAPQPAAPGCGVKVAWLPPAASAFNLLGFASGSAVFFSYGVIGKAPAAPAAAGAAPANNAAAGGPDCALVYNAALGTTTVGAGVKPAAGVPPPPAITNVCTSDIDCDGALASSFNTNISADIIPDPLDAGANVF